MAERMLALRRRHVLHSLYIGGLCHDARGIVPVADLHVRQARRARSRPADACQDLLGRDLEVGRPGA